MKQLLITFEGRASQKDFTFEQVKREENVAIYKKTDKKIPSIIYYEAIHIRKHGDYTIGGVTIPAGERYPSDREFGLYAWNCCSLERAEFRFNEFLNK